MSQLASSHTPAHPAPSPALRAPEPPVTLRLTHPADGADAADAPRRTTVKWFDAKKGFGFLHGPQGQDVFVHYSQINGDGFRRLEDGEPVSYQLERGAKGLLARSVTREADADAVVDAEAAG